MHPAVRRIVRHEGQFHADTAAVTSGAAGILQAAAEQITDGKGIFNGFNISHARDGVRDLAAHLDTVRPGPGAAGAGEGLRQDADRLFVVLVPAEQEHGEMVGVPYGRGLSGVFFTGAEHLADGGAGRVVDGLYGPDGSDGNRRRPRAVHDSAFRRNHGNRPDHAFIPGDVVAQQREQGREQTSQGGPFGTVDGVPALRAGPGEIKGERVILFGHGQLYPVDFILHAQVLARLPLPVGQLPQARAQFFFGLDDQRPAGLIHCLEPVFFNEGQHPRPGDVVAGNHGIQVQRHHVRGAHHVEEGVHDGPVNLSFFHQPQPRRTEAFGINIVRIGTEPAGIGGADIIHVDEAGAPGHQFSLVMDRRHQVHVGGMQGRAVRVVQQEHVTGVDVPPEAPDDGFARLRGAGQVVQETDAAHQQGPVCPVQGHHQIVAFVGDGAAGDVFQSNDGLIHDPEQAVADDRKRDGIDHFYVTSITMFLYPSMNPCWPSWITMVVIGV